VDLHTKHELSRAAQTYTQTDATERITTATFAAVRKVNDE